MSGTTRRLTDDQLLEIMERCPPFNATYRHSESGRDVVVLGGAIDEATLEPVVYYRHTASPVRFVRSLADFFAEVKVNGRKVPRFRPLTAKAARFLAPREKPKGT